MTNSRMCQICQSALSTMPVHLREFDKMRIISKIEDGWSIRRIAQTFNRSKTTIQNIKKRWDNDQTICRKRGTGRPFITTAEQDEALTDYLRENPFHTARHAKVAVNFNASITTALRRIRKTNLKNCAAARKYKLNEEHKQGRLIFALNYVLNDTLNFWGRVIFSDEKVFQSHSDGHIRVYRPPGSRFNENYISSNDKSGRFSVNVWAWMYRGGLGMCWRIEGRLNARNYLDILDGVMLPSVREIFPNDNFIFQHDNCSVHTARSVRNYIAENNIETLPWVAKSPDLNPIENVWGLMVKKLKNLNTIPRNKEHLWTLIEETWESLTEDENLTLNLIDSMPTRLQELINNNGGMTRY